MFLVFKAKSITKRSISDNPISVQIGMFPTQLASNKKFWIALPGSARITRPVPWAFSIMAKKE